MVLNANILPHFVNSVLLLLILLCQIYWQFLLHFVYLLFHIVLYFYLLYLVFETLINLSALALLMFHILLNIQSYIFLIFPQKFLLLFLFFNKTIVSSVNLVACFKFFDEKIYSCSIF